jgi:glycine cleavage system regulatory protein
MATLILTIIGPDRPGLVHSLSEALVAHHGSWLESRMARLAGQFAGIVLVEADESLIGALPVLETGGLRISATVAGAAAAAHGSGPRLRLEVVGNDRPGIIHEVTQVLAGRHVNIEELITDVVSGAFSGQALFRATIVARTPSAEVADGLAEALEHLGDDMMVDIQALEG